MNKDFNKLCTPAKLYFAFSVLSCIIMLFNKVSFVIIFSKLFFAFLWTFALGWICDKGYKAISWFLVLLPFIMMVLVSLRVVRHMKEIDSLNPMN
jgi:hypothetical protein